MANKECISLTYILASFEADLLYYFCRNLFAYTWGAEALNRSYRFAYIAGHTF